jgi:hypothetical protein
MKDKRLWYILLVVSALVLAALACGGSNTGQAVGTSVLKATAVPPTQAIYKAGDVIQFKDHTITLNSTTLQGGILQANFTIINTGSADLNVSSIMSFSAKDSEGTKLEEDIFNCGSALGGKVLPGDKLKGDICWKATTLPVKIYYEPELFGTGATVWEVKQ